MDLRLFDGQKLKIYNVDNLKNQLISVDDDGQLVIDSENGLLVKNQGIYFSNPTISIQGNSSQITIGGTNDQIYLNNENTTYYLPSLLTHQDIDNGTLLNNGYLKYNQSQNKFVFDDLTDTFYTKQDLNSSSGQSFIGITSISDLTQSTVQQQLEQLKNYVDTQVQGLDIKESVRVQTTINEQDIDLSTPPTTIDSVTLNNGDRILVKNQSSNPEQNGIYVYNGSQFVRQSDQDSNDEVSQGMFVFVQEGQSNQDTGWVLTTNDPISLGTTPLNFTQFTGQGGSPILSNLGNGVGVYKNKDGNNYYFKTLSQQSSKISIVDNTTQNTIDFDIVESNLSLNNLSGTLQLNKGGTNNSTYTIGKFIIYDGTKLQSSQYDGNSFQLQGHNHLLQIGDGTNVEINYDTSEVLHIVQGDNTTIQYDDLNNKIIINAQGQVTSVNGYTGDVNLTYSDVEQQQEIHTHVWSNITNTPITLEGYGITDQVKNGGNTPEIIQDVQQNRPDQGTEGRLFIQTDENIMYRDNGTDWDMIGSPEMTQNEILDKLKTVDGSESGLDQDLLDGKDSSEFQDQIHTHTKSDITDFSHTHTKSEITDFSHTHTSQDITDQTYDNVQNTIIKRDQNGDFSQGTITQDLNGNQSTQSQLETQRTISLTGDVSGSTTFDGSQDVSITQTVQNDSHSHSDSTISSLNWSKLLNKPDSSVTDIDDQVNKKHTQNTDVGTTSTTFYIGGTSGVKIKNNSGILEVRNSQDTDYQDLTVNNLTVKGTTTTLDSQNVLINDNIITLNSNYTGSSPTLNQGIEVERGTLTNQSLIWDESNDLWKQGLQSSEKTLVKEGNTVVISGDVSGTQNFNSLGNVSIQQSINDSTILNKLKNVDGSGSGLDQDLLDGMQPSSNNTQNTIVKRDQNGNFSQGTITQSLNGNQSTQSKLQTQRTISLTGDVSGSTTFDGSQNVSISQTVSNQTNQDKVDGLHASQFVRSDTSDTMNGTLTVVGNVNANNILPRSNNTYTMGSDTSRWKEGYYNDKVVIGNYEIVYNSSTNSLDFNFLG